MDQRLCVIKANGVELCVWADGRWEVALDETGRDGEHGNRVTWRAGRVAVQDETPIEVGHVWIRRERTMPETFPGRFRGSVVAASAGSEGGVVWGERLRFEILGRVGEVVGVLECRWGVDAGWRGLGSTSERTGGVVFELLSVEGVKSLVFPTALEAPGGLVMPEGVGKWYRKPMRGTWFFRPYSGGIGMRCWGGLGADLDSAVLVVPEKGHADLGVMATARHASPGFLQSMGRWDGTFPRRVLYRFVRGGWNGLANCYRAYARHSGMWVSLAEKRERCPAVGNLIGGRELNFLMGHLETPERQEDQFLPVTAPPGGEMVVRMTYREVLEVIEAAQRLGWTKGVSMVRGWCAEGYDGRHPDVWPPTEAFGPVSELKESLRRRGGLGTGIIGGIHDNVGDMYSHAPSFPHGVVRREDGRPMPGGYWRGGQAYLTQSRAMLAYSRRNWPDVSSLGFDKLYCDIITAMYLNQSYGSGEDRQTRMQDFEGRIDLMKFFKSCGVALASEEGADFAMGLLDAADTTHQRRVTAETATIPFFPLVFHGAAVLARHHTQRADAGEPRVPWWSVNLLWGYSTMWGISWGTERGFDWKAGFDDFRVEKWHERVAEREMVSHRFDGDDLGAEVTEFSGGLTARANFTVEERTIAGKRVAPWDTVVE